MLKKRQIILGVMKSITTLFCNLLPVAMFTTFIAFSGQSLDLKTVVAAIMYSNYIMSPPIMLSSFKSMSMNVVLSM